MRAIDHVDMALKILRTGDANSIVEMYRQSAPRMSREELKRAIELNESLVKKNQDIAERKKTEMTTAGYDKGDVRLAYLTWMGDSERRQEAADFLTGVLAKRTGDASWGGGRHKPASSEMIGVYERQNRMIDLRRSVKELERQYGDAEGTGKERIKSDLDYARRELTRTENYEP